MSNIPQNTPVKRQNTPVRRSNTPVMPSASELMQLSQVCSTLAETPFYRKLGGGGVLAIWLTATELGIPPMMALNGGLWTFDGKVTMSTQCMNYMIVNKGHRADVVNLNDEGCTIKFIRSDRPEGDNEFIYTYTLRDAQKSGLLGKDNWKKNPRDMCFNRCLSGGARKFMPDVLMQAYTYEEMCDSDETFEVAYKTKDQDWDQVEEQKKPEEQQKEQPKQISQEQVLEFRKKWGLDDSEGPEIAYIKDIALATNKTQDDIIEIAIKNEERFENGFNKWLEEKPNVTQD